MLGSKGFRVLRRWIHLLFLSFLIDVVIIGNSGRKNGQYKFGAAFVESFASSRRHQRCILRKIVTNLQQQPNNDDDGKDRNFSEQIRFLGKGSNAIVREGVVLLAPAEEFHHYLRQSALFIYAMGLDENEDYVIRGVILDNPTPFTMGEMMTVARTEEGIYKNLIYRGGETGGQEAFCLHSSSKMGREEIGTSGVYQGGDLQQLAENEDGDITKHKVKFFFNYMEFLEQELEDMLDIVHEDGDGWTSVEVPSDIVLNSDCEKGEIWTKLRNAIRERI